MRKINLVSLELTNYRNIDHQRLEFDGNSKIIGENRIGKTNTLEAIVWVLTDKLLNGNTDISSIKPISDTSKPVTVEATFSVDGNIHTIKKVYGENLVKRRNTTELYMEGHYCEYHYDGIKQATLKAFNSLFTADFGIPINNYEIEILRLLTDPLYIGELGDSKDWTKLRAFIIGLVGDVDDNEIYQKEPTLTGLKADIDSCYGRTDQLKKKYQTTIESCKNDLIGFDAQIDLLSKTDNPSDDEVIVAQKALNDLDQDIINLKNSATSTKTDWVDEEINKLNERLNDEKAAALEKAKEKDTGEIQELKKQECDLYNKLGGIANRKTLQSIKLKQIENGIEECKSTRTKVIETAQMLDDLLKDSDNAVCHICGQPLPPEKIQEKKEKLLKEKEENHQLGLSNRERNEKLLKEYETETLVAMEIEKELKAVNDEIDAVTVKTRELQENETNDNPFDTEVIKSLETEIEDLYKKKAQLRADTELANSEIRQKIYEKQNAKAPFQKVIDDRNYFERQMTKLDSVRELKNDKTNELVTAEQKQDLLKLFIRTKLDLLNKHVELVFDNIKFDLIKENINGGYDAVCKPHIINSNVLWKSGSKSEKVITGITLADKIKSKLNLPNFPYLFDEGGEISNETFAERITTDSQIICVKVEDNINKPIVVKI